MTRLISIYGDSISTFAGTQPDDYAVFYRDERLEDSGVDAVEKTWWMQVIGALDATFCANAAWSGSMVEGAGYPAGTAPERIAKLAGPDGQAPDDILIYFGINDYGWGSSDAQAAGRANAAPRCLAEQGLLPPEGVAGMAPADIIERFGAAYALMLERMHASYPDARIWCISLLPGRVRGHATSTFPYNFRGAAFDAYNQAIAQAAAQCENARFCDAASFGLDYEGMEGTHPTALGMKQIAWLVAQCMREFGEDIAIGPDEYPGGVRFASSDPCEEPGRPCVGCPHALSTANFWMHVCRY